MSAESWTKVFLSYARADAAALEARLAVLQQRGITVLRDSSDILPSEAWRARIVSLIGEADTVVCALSPGFAMSEACAWEVQTARTLKKRLVPLLLAEVPPAALPEALSELNWLPWQPALPAADAADALQTVLTTDIDWIREHTRLGALAAHWSASGEIDAPLLRGPALEGAEAWLASRPATAPAPTEAQQKFISASRAADLARRRRTLRLVCGIAGVTVLLAGWAVWSSLEARHNLRVAESRRYAMLAEQALGEGISQRAALLAAHALELTTSGDGPVVDAIGAARRVLATVSGSPWLPLRDRATAMSQMRGGRLAVAGLSFVDQRSVASLTVAQVGADGSAQVLCRRPAGSEVVTHLALSADGQVLTAVSDDRVVRMRVAADGCVPLLDLPHSHGRSGVVAMHPHGRWLALGGDILAGPQLLDLDAAGAPRPLGPLAGRPAAMAWSDDGRVLVVASDHDGRGTVDRGAALAVAWQFGAQGPVERRVLLAVEGTPAPAAATAVAVSVQAAVASALIGRRDGTTTMIRMPLGADAPARGGAGQRAAQVSVRHVGSPSEARVSAVAAAASAAQFWVGRTNGQVSLLDAAASPGTAVESERSAVSTRDILRLRPAQDGRGVAVASRDAEGWAADLRWCAASGSGGALQCRALVGHEGGMVDIAPGPGGNHLYSASQDLAVRRWTATTAFQSLAGQQWSAPKGGRLAESLDGAHWFVAGADGSRADVLGVSAPATGALPPIAGRTLAVSENGRWRVSSAGGGIRVEDLSGSVAATDAWRAESAKDDLVAVSEDGGSVAWLRQGSRVLEVWRRGGGPPRSVGLPRQGYAHLAWSPAADWLAIAEMQGQLLLWPDPLSGRTVPLPAEGVDGDHRGLAWHPGGRWLASAGFDAQLTLWDVACTVRTPACPPRRVKADYQLRMPRFSPDGRWLACASVGGEIPVWPVSSGGLGTPVRRLRGHDGDVVAIAFSTDSRRLASASFSWSSSDSSLRVWDLQAADPAATVDEIIRGGDWYADVRLDRRHTAVVGLTQDGEVRWFPLGAQPLQARLRAFAARDFTAFERGRYLGPAP